MSDWPAQFLLPVARVRHSASQSVPANAVDQALAFDTIDDDTDQIHSTTVNNTRLTCKTPGRYLIYADIVTQGATNVVVLWEGRIVKNGTTNLARNRSVMSVTGNPGPAAAFQVVAVASLVQGDYVELVVNQNTTGALNIQALGSESPVFSMSFVSK